MYKKKRICKIHNQPIYGVQCNICRAESIKAWKKKSAAKTMSKKKATKKKNKGTTLTNLKNKLQSMVRKNMVKRLKGTKHWYCWICSKRTNQTGLFGLHCAHYYAKGHVWRLWNHKNNVFPCCYDCNVNKPETVAVARMRMDQIYGVEEMKNVDKLAEQHINAVNANLMVKKPQKLHILALIEETKSQDDW